MALDEPRDTDNVFNVNGFQFIIDKEFYEKAKPVTVDFMDMVSDQLEHQFQLRRRLRGLSRVLQHDK